MPYFLSVIFFLAGVIIGFLIWGNNSAPVNLTPQAQPEVDTRLFFTQNAYIRGKIIQVLSEELKITSTNNNLSETFGAAYGLVIISPANKVSKGDLSTIELNKEAVIGLEMLDGKYQVVSIQYTTPQSSPRPAPSLATKVQPSVSP